MPELQQVFLAPISAQNCLSYAHCSSSRFSAIVRPITTSDGLLQIGGSKPMPTRELLSPAQRAQFLSLPAQMSEQMLARHYTLSSEDLARIRRHRRPHNKLGFAVQLAYLRFPWRTWTASDDVSPPVLSYIANQLKVNPMGII